MLTSLLLLGSPAALAAEPVLQAPTAVVQKGGAATLTFRESLPGNVLVDGCAAVELERREGEVWRAEPVAVCPQPVAAMEVAGELTLSATVPTAGSWRARVVWGVSCTPGLPLPMAACGRLGVATSEAFEVGE